MPYLALVVEDEAVLRDIYKVILMNFGFEVLEAADGEEALTLLQNNRPDLIFLDMLLPKVNGVAILHEVHTAPHLRHTRIVIISAHNRFTRSEYLKPDDMFLLKPVRPDDIRQAVNQFLATI